MVDDTFRNILSKVIFIGEKGKTLEKVLQDLSYHPFDTITNYRLSWHYGRHFIRRKFLWLIMTLKMYELADMVNEARKISIYRELSHKMKNGQKNFFTFAQNTDFNAI